MDHPVSLVEEPGDMDDRGHRRARSQDQPPQPYMIFEQSVELEVHFREKRLSGRVEVWLYTLEKIDEIALDARQSIIDVENITVEAFRGSTALGAKKVPASYTDKYSLLRLPTNWSITAEHHDIRRTRMQPIVQPRAHDLPANSRDHGGCTPVDGSLKIKLRPKDDVATDRPKLIIRKSTLGSDVPLVGATQSQQSDVTQYKITVPFSTPEIRDGVQFVGVDPGDMRFPHVFSRHSIEPGTASCIFPCVDDYGTRCDWRMALKMPRTLGDALEQALVTQQAGDSGGGQKQERHYTLEEKDKLLEMTAVCSGRLSDELVDPLDHSKKIMKFESQRRASAQKIGFAIAPFEHVDLWSAFRTEEDDEKLGANALKIHGYCLPGRADMVRNTCAAIAAAADFFTMTFATHPFDSFKLCFVDDMLRDTEPLHSFSLISNRLLYPDDIIDPEIDVTRTIVLSLASQWAGINLVANTREDLWLVVGIAHYMTELFMKRLCGNNEYRFRMKTLSDQLVELDVNRPSLHELGKLLRLGDFEMDFMALKAPLVLFILDKRLTKATGSAGLTKILSKLLVKANIQDSDSVVSTESFRRACERGGKSKLDAFWAQWVFGSGCPRFKMTQRFNKKRLCIEMTLRQIQGDEAGKKRPLEKSEFLRLVRESLHGITHGATQHLFTGPMTIRIHEADGTPYEHIVEIREDAMRVAKFEIPYNTKYKRLKRTRRQKERANAGANVDANGDHIEDALLYCLGDVLQTPDEMAAWELHDWDADVEKKMDQESYEWIRMDADFEWLCSMTTNLESYMYVSQLQQDRDVAAQQDSMVFLSTSPRHPLVSTILTRTIVDRRYFHGIRTMAADMLPRHANIDALPLLGFRHLLKAFVELFCYPDTLTPRPNDFSDKKQYVVQTAIIRAMARVRDKDGRCPEEGKRFILNQLLMNNNDDNHYSDHHYVAVLLEALATSLIPDKKKDETSFDSATVGMNMGFDDADDDDGMELDFVGATAALAKTNAPEKQDPLLAAALELIDRYRRRDEWEQSFNNIWTVAALDAKQRLMKAKVVPTDGVEFLQYLLDGTHDLVRIKAFEALVDLGLFLDIRVFRFFMCVVSTDRSPFVRDRLLKALSSGLAALAFGELSSDGDKAAKTSDSSDLVIMDSTQTVEDRKADHLRRESLPDALQALKHEIQSKYADQEMEFQNAMTVALESPVLGRSEVQVLLEICSVLFDEADRFLVTLQYPKRWKIVRPPEASKPGKLILTFKSYFKTAPAAPPAPPPEPTPAVVPVARTPLPLPATAPSMAPPHKSSEPPSLQKRNSIILKSSNTGSKIGAGRSASISSKPPAVQGPQSPSPAVPSYARDTSSSAKSRSPSIAPSTAASTPRLLVTSKGIPGERKVIDKADRRVDDKRVGLDKKVGEKLVLSGSKALSGIHGSQDALHVKTPKRPRPDKYESDLDGPTPVHKKIKVDSDQRTALPAATNGSSTNGSSTNGSSTNGILQKPKKKRCMVTLKCRDPSKYPNIFRKRTSAPHPPASSSSSKHGLTPLPTSKPSSSSSALKVRKPLPDSAPTHQAVATPKAAAPKPSHPPSSSTPQDTPRPKITLKLSRKPTHS